MGEHKDNVGFGEQLTNLERKQSELEIEHDADTLEPFDDTAEHRVINTDDPAEVTRWAKEFQVNESDLLAVVLLNGNAVREVKKYLSI